MSPRSTLFSASIIGVTGVALGAFGAHALRETLVERGTTVPWETASRYQMFHAVALIAVAAWRKNTPDSAQRFGAWTALCWTIGVVLFCGSLYGIALGGPRWLGPVTPLGGLALLSGWVCLGIAAAKDS